MRPKIDYITDQFLPTDATDTIQLVTMASAMGAAGAELRLVFPVPSARAEVPDSAAAIADYYGVHATFEALPVPGPYPAPFKFRGLEKLFHAVKAARAVRSKPSVTASAAGAPVIYTRNLPVALAALAATDSPIFYETYRPWPRQSRSKKALFSALRRSERFAGMILHSELAASSYREIGYLDERLLVAHNGINPGRFDQLPEKATLREALGIATDRTIALYSGHVSPAKGIGILLDAAARLPDITFVIVGSTGETDIERRARTMANVMVVPWQSPGEVERWLLAADMLLIPPTRGPLDTIGNTVLPIKTFQYLAAGRVIVAPDTEDLREVLADGVNAVLVPPDDLAAFVARLDAVSRDREGMSRLALAARESGMQNTWERRATRVLDFISSRVAGSKRVRGLDAH